MTNPISAATATAAAQSAATSNAARAGNQVISADFQTFLQMLTAQMTNQDPLNPIDSSDYAVQLATFSSVEQQVLTNDLLTSLISQVAGSDISQLAGWVGMEARTAGPVYFGGDPVALAPLPARRADEAWLVARDETGSEVARQPIGLSGDQIVWTGLDSDGQPLAPGLYSFEVENHAEGTLLGSTPVESYARVAEAQNIDGTMVLLLEGGVRGTVLRCHRPAPSGPGLCRLLIAGAIAGLAGGRHGHGRNSILFRVSPG